MPMTFSFKNFSRLVFIILAISLLLTNCQKDDLSVSTESEKIVENNPAFELKTKSFNELNQNSKFSKAFEDVFSRKNTTSKIGYKNFMEEYDFAIDTTSIKEMSLGDYSSYTFFISRKKSDDAYFENLVLEVDSTNNIKAVIVKYVLNSDIVETVDNSFSIDAEIEVTDIIYENIQSKSSSGKFNLNGECVGIPMCPWGDGPDHLAGQACHDANRGDIYLDTGMCTDGGGGGEQTGDGGTTTTSGGDTGTDDTSGGGGEGTGETCNTCGGSGGNGSTSTTEEEPNPIITNIIPRSYDEQLFIDYIKTLSFPERNFINDVENVALKEGLFNHLERNDFSIEAKDFAEIAIEAMMVDKDLAIDVLEQILKTEQDYKARMSTSELLIFESMPRINQLSYLANAQFATWKSEELFPSSLYNGKGDAFRHAYWNAANVNDLGLALAESLTTAHEDKPFTYTYNFKEKNMDLFNNQVGRNKWNFPLDGYETLEQSILDAINTGDLRYLDNLAANRQATGISSLIPTNQ